jgi:hypothetical protein
MVEEELVHGEGWISDDSSFYGKYDMHPRHQSRQSRRLGCLRFTNPNTRLSSQPFIWNVLLTFSGSEDEQNHQYSLCQSFKPQRVWSAPKSDLNVLLAPSRSQRRSENMSCYSIDAIGDANFLKNRASNSSEEGDSKPMTFLLDRRAMEEARLARMGKRKREPSPEPVLFNLGQGSPDAWQLGESADDFVKRLPPLSTSVLTCTWIWVHNPHFDVRDKNKSTSHRAEEFRSHGADLLSQSLQARQQLQTKGLHGPRGPVTKSLNEESKALQQRINDLAVECEILSGKVSQSNLQSHGTIHNIIYKELTMEQVDAVPEARRSD